MSEQRFILTGRTAAPGAFIGHTHAEWDALHDVLAIADAAERGRWLETLINSASRAPGGVNLSGHVPAKAPRQDGHFIGANSVLAAMAKPRPHRAGRRGQ